MLKGERSRSISCTPKNVTYRHTAPPRPTHPFQTPTQLVYGGREELQYFDDTWLFDLAHMSWHQVEPAAGNDVPPGRDHHAVAYVGAKMYVWGEWGWRCCWASLKIDTGHFQPLYTWRRPNRTSRMDLKPSMAAVGSCLAALRRVFPAIQSDCTLKHTGGRSGANYCESRPMDELWAFALATRTWQRVAHTPLSCLLHVVMPAVGMRDLHTARCEILADGCGAALTVPVQVEQAGEVPLPRFEHAYTQYQPAGKHEGGWKRCNEVLRIVPWLLLIVEAKEAHVKSFTPWLPSLQA
jgi:hypothetical protein